MKQATYRTCIRLTLIKGQNDLDMAGYKQLIERGSPDFIEVKGYMHVGASRKYLGRENMPMHSEVDDFTKELIESLDDYEIVSEHTASRVLCLIHKRMNKQQYIDFPKFFEIVNNDGIAKTLDYSSDKMTPNC